ncbi:sensor domain-containing diguanylate cyclase [Solibacillus isronensis]|uniref:sensor domain-containing diguanylate cyclase n=1 Tax=Solibacillus isronensis TaxID=412383 RepID=UPI00203D7A92|nr:sensor domain-containing diguanylate cyclase [Solibacillus isronensis]MCM3723626.1 sensor domain-containing diguanylate cyclase [Solibacillus isronensis]
MFLFIFGLVTGLIIYWIYTKYYQSKFQNENISLKLVERSHDIIYYYEVKPVYRHRYTSPSVDLFLGEGTLEALYRDSNTPFEMIHPEDKTIMENKISGQINYNEGIIQRLKGTDGIYRWFEEYTTPIYENGEIVAIQGIMRNIDEKIKLEQELQYRSTHDALTDIYNRGYFEQMINYYNKEKNVALGIILCDLDQLKYVNDTYGHKKGDQYIEAAAKLLKSTFSGNVIVSRVGGDEFAVIIPNTTMNQIEMLCNLLREKTNHHPVLSNDINLQMSIGMAFSEQSAGKTESLYIEADKKMYEEKKQKRKPISMLH